VSSTANMLIS